jgi:hypothetical protein
MNHRSKRKRPLRRRPPAHRHRPMNNRSKRKEDPPRRRPRRHRHQERSATFPPAADFTVRSAPPTAPFSRYPAGGEFAPAERRSRQRDAPARSRLTLRRPSCPDPARSDRTGTGSRRVLASTVDRRGRLPVLDGPPGSCPHWLNNRGAYYNRLRCQQTTVIRTAGPQR